MNNDIVKYINESKSKGIALDAIKQSLVANGWREEDLMVYFAPEQKSQAINVTVASMNWREKLIHNFPSISLRVGLGFVFIYAAIFVSGDARTGAKYVPAFVTHVLPLSVFLPVFSAFEVILALWILSGKFRRYSGLVTALFLITITIINYSFLNVTFRNVAIIGAALAFATI